MMELIEFFVTMGYSITLMYMLLDLSFTVCIEN